MASTPVYLEVGSKRVFACAVEWPGWARSGRDEAAALEALHASAPRYARVAGHAGLPFAEPRSPADLRVVERVRGDATTDFGAPGGEPKADRAPLGNADLRRLVALIEAAWRTFDEAARSARGKTLAKGPRGGGRTLAAIARHVREAEAGYLGGLGWRLTRAAKGEAALAKATREAVLEGIAASARGEIAAKGPRGGVRWKPRKFARRLAWHAIDHAWEIEDRAGVSRTPARVPPTRASGPARPARPRSCARR